MTCLKLGLKSLKIKVSFPVIKTDETLLHKNTIFIKTTLLSGDSDRTRKNGMELHHGMVSLGVRKRFLTRGWWAWIGLPRQWSLPQAAGVQEVQAFGQHSQKYGLNFGWPCVRQGLELDAPWGPLMT